MRVNVPNGHGAGVTIERHGRQWLITARHVVEGVDPADVVVVTRDGPTTVKVADVSGVRPAADVAVFALESPVTPQDVTLIPDSDGTVFSQEAYFLGYPFGLGLRTAGITLPFVKRAVISAFERSDDRHIVWLLDGINNPGRTDWHVIAIVSGYRAEQTAVTGGTGTVATNTGIIVAHDISHAIEAIDAAC